MSNQSTKTFKKRENKIKKQQRKRQVTLSSNNTATNAQPAVVIVTQSSLDIVNRAAIGVISFALQRGYASVAESPDFPFFAQIYLGSLMINAMQSVNPGVQKVPQWLHKLMHLLNPKQSDYSGGLLSYTWNIDFEAVSSTWITDLAPFGCHRTWNSGVIDPSSTINNDIPELVTPSNTYTPELGAQAWTSVLNFITSISNIETELISVFEESSFDRVYTAFSDTTRQVGAAGSSNGGLLKVQKLEVPIKYPNLGAFSIFSATNRGDITRVPQHLRVSSCDALFVTGALCSELPSSIVKSNSPPIIKPIDFNEYLDVLGIWVSQLQTAYSLDIQESAIISNDPTSPVCPLTFQEVALLLRNEFMNALDKSQYAIQGVYPNNQNNTNQFAPFICGQGTFGVRTNGMLLPQLLVENIRVSTLRYETGKNPKAYFPSIGVYCEDDLPWNAYAFTGVDSGPFTSFTSPLTAFNYDVPAERVKKGQVNSPFKISEKEKDKDQVITKVLAETFVSVIDGSSGGSFYAINHQASLEQLTTLWNTWINQFRPFTDKLTTVSADGGLLAAPMVNITALITDQENLTIMGKEKPVYDKKHCTRLDKRITSGAPVYLNRFQLAISSEEPLMSHTWGILQSLWISPQFFLRIATDIENAMTYEKMKTLTKEPFGFVLTDNGTSISYADRHLKYAAAMVHARNGKANAVMDVISELEKRGRAGLLSSMLGKGLGALIPGASGIIDAISSVLPI